VSPLNVGKKILWGNIFLFPYVPFSLQLGFSLYFPKIGGDMAPLAPPGYTYALDMFNTVSYASNDKNTIFRIIKYGSPYQKEVDC